MSDTLQQRFLSADKGPNGQCAQVVSYWDASNISCRATDGFLQVFTFNLIKSEDSSDGVAKDISHSVTKSLALPESFHFNGSAPDSGGGGTKES